MHLYKDNILSKPVILDYLSISSQTFDHILSLWNATGEVVRETNGIWGCPWNLHFSDVKYLKHLIWHCPDWFLDELQYMLQTNCFISMHFATVHWELVQAGISEKKIKKAASECNEDLQADYIGWMGQYSPEQLGFLDEVSKDECTSSWSHGQSHKGTWAIMKGVFIRGWCFYAEGLLSIDGMVASTVVEGSMTQDLFIEYLEFTVVFCYCPYHYSWSIIYILDAALRTISWNSKCVSDGQHKDSSWGRDSWACRALQLVFSHYLPDVDW